MGKHVGVEYLDNEKCRFTVWAPEAKTVAVVLKKYEDPFRLEQQGAYWEATIEGVIPGDLYQYIVDGEGPLPDPASLSQPMGVHSWSQVLDQKAFSWTDQSWKGRETRDMILYELHTGTFTQEGTFQGITAKLDHLEELGINTIEIMPIAQFPGSRNWGYDGVYPYAVQDSYGGVAGLKQLVNTCHQRGFAVILDVVYNHLGPEGNYLPAYGPCFTDKYHTPWGSAINFDDAYSDGVREFFLQNALMWLRDFHIDGLRLDAVHEIIDRGAVHFLEELSRRVNELEEECGRRLVIIAESDLNDARLVRDLPNGFGLEAQWVDDFHHCVHTVLTGEKAGYYMDYGTIELLEKSFRQAFVYDGSYSVFRKKRIGNSPQGLPPDRFVVSVQNHDQVGNRLLGERLSTLVSFEKQKLAAGLLLLAPYVPMLFMGEEFGAGEPFRYFISHGDEDLVRAVREGRRKEFEYFNHSAAEFPDPQAETSFQESKLDWNFKNKKPQSILFSFYKELIQLRKKGTFRPLSEGVETQSDTRSEILRVRASSGALSAWFNFGKQEQLLVEDLQAGWELVFFSAQRKWGGSMEGDPLFERNSLRLPPESFVIITHG